MAKLCPLWFLYIVVAVYIVWLSENSYAAVEDRKIHIVYMGGLREGEALTSTYHTDMLRNVVHSSVVEKTLIRSYTRSFNGFATYLTEEEPNKLAMNKGPGSRGLRRADEKIPFQGPQLEKDVMSLEPILKSFSQLEA